MSKLERVCLIGCGPSGMAFLAAMKKAEQKGKVIPEIVCFEKQNSMTGLWNYTWKTGLDDYGEYVHGSMHNALWSNTPKECMELADYTFKEHFNKSLPSFLPRVVIRDYLLGRAEKYNLLSQVRLHTVVRHVKNVDGQFGVLVQDLVSKKLTEEYFDYVIVATGHFSFPEFPKYEGLEDFPGRILHSHDFKKADEFLGQKVLVVGAGFSGEDIALQLHKFGVKDIIISYRQRPLGFSWPDNITEVPEINKIEGRIIQFINGISIEADTIIFCTGYKHHFPFLDENIRLQCDNNMYPDHLYQGVVFQDNIKICYMGMQNQFFTFPMFDAQAYYIRDYLLGKIQLGSYTERQKEIDEWRKSEKTLVVFDDLCHFQTDYILELLSVSKSKPANTISKMTS